MLLCAILRGIIWNYEIAQTYVTVAVILRVLICIAHASHTRARTHTLTHASTHHTYTHKQNTKVYPHARTLDTHTRTRTAHTHIHTHVDPVTTGLYDRQRGAVSVYRRGVTSSTIVYPLYHHSHHPRRSSQPTPSPPALIRLHDCHA